MDSFSYLSVLLSIILGLAITQILQGVRLLVLHRAHVRWHMPTLVWTAILPLIVIQSWWSSFGLRTHSRWTFASFLVILLHSATLYMAAALALPDVAGDRETDLADHYARNHRWLFATMLAGVVLSLLKDLTLGGRLPEGRNLAFHLLFALLATVAIVVRDARVHRLLAPLTGLIFAGYVALLFERL